MALTYFITCQICMQRFDVPSFEDMLATELGRERLGAILEKLHVHVAENHKTEFTMAKLPAAQLNRLLVLNYFRTEDAQAIEMREYMRHQLHMMTMNREVTDEAITRQLKDLRFGATQKKLPAEFHTGVMLMMQQMRDILQEAGPFKPKQPGIPATAPGPVLITS